MRHNLIDAITVYHKRGKMNCFKLFCGITLCIFGTLLYSAHAAKGKKKKQGLYRKSFIVIANSGLSSHQCTVAIICLISKHEKYD